MKTYEVYEKIVKEGITKFVRRSDGQVYEWKNNQLRPSDPLTGWYPIELDEDWTLYRQPVSFREMLEKVAKKGSDVKITIIHPAPFELYDMRLDNLLLELENHHYSDELASVLLEGKFYIVEIEREE